MKTLGIICTLVGITIWIWTTGAFHLGHQIAYTVLLLGASAFVLGILKSKAPDTQDQVVGDLAGVLEALGEQLRDANKRPRGGDTIEFGSAEVQLALTAEKSSEGTVSFKVVDGASANSVSRSTKVTVTAYPFDAMGIGQ